MNDPVGERSLIICTSNGHGGLENLVLTLSQGLRALDISVQTVFPPAEGDALGCLPMARQIGASMETSEAVTPIARRRQLRHFLALRAFVYARDIPSVNIHYGSNFISIWDVLAIRLAGVRRCVATVHHAVPITTWKTKRLTALASMFCDHVTVTTPAMTDILVAAGVARHKIVEIPPGIRPPVAIPSRADARAALGLPLDALIVGSLGRIVPHKGFGDLIAAMSLLDPCPRTVHLVVGGDGPARQTFEASAATSLGDRAHFLGRIPDAALLYAASDVFVLPSHEEGFGLVFVEAAFYGIPSIGTSVGGVPYAIIHGETGILVPPHSPHELALALHHLLSDDATRKRLGRAAQVRAHRQFTVRAMAEAYRACLSAFPTLPTFD